MMAAFHRLIGRRRRAGWQVRSDSPPLKRIHTPDQDQSNGRSGQAPNEGEPYYPTRARKPEVLTQRRIDWHFFIALGNDDSEVLDSLLAMPPSANAIYLN
jgi:hypothetical protein